MQSGLVLRCLVVDGPPTVLVNSPFRYTQPWMAIDSLEQQNMWLRLMHLIVLPTQTLRDAQASPLVLPQEL